MSASEQIVGPSARLADALAERVVDAITGFPADDAEKEKIGRAVVEKLDGQFPPPDAE